MNQHSSYVHPSEGKPLAIRFLIATLAIGFVLAICSAPKAEGAIPNPARFGGKCRVVASDADHDTGKVARIAARHGGVDYTGAKYGPGVWTVNDTGAVFAWSAHEDAILYSTLRCAKIRPAYVG